jgi:hypothetical protein
MTPNPDLKMPKWLLYGLITKGLVVVLITAAVLAYAFLG